MNIGLLGGAFNPPHYGHLIIARQILDFTDVDEIWFLPNFGQIPPKQVADVTHRLAMTRLLTLDHARVSTIEIDHELDGDTIHLLPYLPPEHAYRFIIGSDQLPTFHLWGRWEELLSRLPFLVFPRYGFPNVPLYQNMSVVSDPLLISTDISSTKIRNRLVRGLTVVPFVPPEIIEYITTHGLYR